MARLFSWLSRHFLHSGALILLAVALGAVISVTHAQAALDYEIWALDQGTHQVHIFDANRKEIDRIDLSKHGVRNPHMIDFTSDHAYAFIASVGSGDVTIIHTADRKVVDVIKTGPRTHMAAVKPDDRAVIVDVIGSTDVTRDGELVEITIDRANGQFQLGRRLTIAKDPVFKEQDKQFKDSGPICHDYTADGRHAYVTLGPSLEEGGLVILDTEAFRLVRAIPPGKLAVNCGTLLAPDGRHMLLNGGSGEKGMWYVMDTQNQSLVHQAESRGRDAHGVWATPDGREIWMVNRVTSNAIVIDPKTFKVIAETDQVGKTPDIIAMAPDSRYAFITLRGPNPVTAPHVAKGDTPGFAVVDIAQRKLVQVVQPAAGNEASDFHGIGVRVIGQAQPR